MCCLLVHIEMSETTYSYSKKNIFCLEYEGMLCCHHHLKFNHLISEKSPHKRKVCCYNSTLQSPMSPLAAQYCAACPQRCSLHTLRQRIFLAKLILFHFSSFSLLSMFIFLSFQHCTACLQLAHSHCNLHNLKQSGVSAFSRKKSLLSFSIFLFHPFFIFSALC